MRITRKIVGFRCRLLAIGFVTAVISTGCSPEDAKAKVKTVTKQTHARATGPAWNWEAYPPMKRMRVATLPCQLQPKSTITVISPIAGLLRVYVNAPQSHLAANTLWGEFEPEIFAQEEENIKEQLKRIEDQEKIHWEVEYPREKAKLAEQVEQAEREVNYVRLLSTNQALASKTLSIGTNGTLLRPDALLRAEENLKLLKRNLSFVEATNFAALRFDAVAQRNDWKRRELEFQTRRRQSRFEMPFDGKLTLGIPVSEGVTNYPVNVGQELAVARDISTVRVRVAMDNVAWTGLAPDKMEATVRSGGQLFVAKFAFQKIERIQNREESAYYFEFPAEKAAAVSRLIGANVSCDLWMDLPEAARIVPKLAMVLHRPDAFENKDWGSAVASTFPGARLLVEGQTDLAVVIPGEIKFSSVK